MSKDYDVVVVGAGPGGYVAAIMSTNVFPVPATGGLIPIWQILIEMVVAAAICAGLAIIVGIPALRLRGIYLALATIAFVEVLRILSQTLDITAARRELGYQPTLDVLDGIDRFAQQWRAHARA